MRRQEVALVPGDGAGPEMMVQACRVVKEAARLDDMEIVFKETPMGWAAWKEYGDTFPQTSLHRATEIGLLFFGGVGDPTLDNTIGNTHPEMRPETRALLGIRKHWQLLLNFRPMEWYPALAPLSSLRPDLLPTGHVRQIFVRYLLQDSYFGTGDLVHLVDRTSRIRIGLKRKEEVMGNEDLVSEVSYYSRDMLQRYFHAAFSYARANNLPVICVDKANVMPRYLYWRKVAQQIGKEHFPDIPLQFQLVDSANALLVRPEKLHGVIVCGNEHGDIVSDGAAAVLGSLGMMHSSAVNPVTGQAMFESGAGTAPDIAGQGIANPIGRILAGALMLEHIGAHRGAESIRSSVQSVLTMGYRTSDILVRGDVGDETFVGTEAMTDAILERLEA